MRNLVYEGPSPSRMFEVNGRGVTLKRDEAQLVDEALAEKLVRLDCVKEVGKPKPSSELADPEE